LFCVLVLSESLGLPVGALVRLARLFVSLLVRLQSKIALFAVFTILTALLLAATFLLFQRLFGANAFEQRTIILNNQPFQFSRRNSFARLVGSYRCWSD
jgi:hypothetical protein